MSWIKEISYEESSGELREVYDLKDASRSAPSAIWTVMSLRPDALRGRIELMRAVTFGGSGLGRRKEELINVSVAGMLGCKY